MAFTVGHPREKTVAIADIGSSSVGISIVHIPADGPAQVVIQEERVLSLDERKLAAAVSAIGSGVAEVTEAALKKYTADGKRSNISDVWAIVHAPWSRSGTTLVISKLDDEKIIATHMIEQLKERAASAEADLDTKNIVESHVVRTLLNGYPTMTPIGKHAHELSIATLLSDCNAKIRTAVTETLTRTFAKEPQLCSCTYALLRVIPRTGEEHDDYIIADMTSEATSMTIVREGLAAEHLVVQVGAHSIIRKIAGKGMPEETLSLMRMVFRDECEGAACDAIKKSVADIEPDLVRTFGEAFGELAKQRRLPGTMILAVMPDIAPWLQQFFSRIDFTQFTVSAQPFVVEVVGIERMQSFATFAQGVTPDVRAALGAALVRLESTAT